MEYNLNITCVQFCNRKKLEIAKQIFVAFISQYKLFKLNILSEKEIKEKKKVSFC